MKILKDNAYDIVRFFVFQIGIAIFSLMLYFSITVVDDATASLYIQFAISVFSILFYLFLVYTASWDYGAKDKIRIDGGRMDPTPAKGAIMVLAANFLNFALALICVFFSGFYLAGAADWFNTVFGVFNMIMRLICAMYIGVINFIFISVENQTLAFFLESIGYLAAPLIGVLVSHIAYTRGLKDKRLFASKKINKE